MSIWLIIKTNLRWSISSHFKIERKICILLKKVVPSTLGSTPAMVSVVVQYFQISTLTNLLNVFQIPQHCNFPSSLLSTSFAHQTPSLLFFETFSQKGLRIVITKSSFQISLCLTTKKLCFVSFVLVLLVNAIICKVDQGL